MKRMRKLFGLGIGIFAIIFLIQSAAYGDLPFVRLSSHVYLMRDVVNVYVIKAKGDSNLVLCIDFGDGKVLDEISRRGWQLDKVIHTHWHRDQCQGDRKLGVSTKIVVPAGSEEYFNSDSINSDSNIWRRAQVYNVYGNIDWKKNPDSIDGRFDAFFVSRTPISIGETLPVSRNNPGPIDWQWDGYTFKVYWTGGHSPWHIMIVVEIDDKKYAFSGDLLYSPAKIWNYWSYQTVYGGEDYRDQQVEEVKAALEQLISLNPPVTDICPSHGNSFKCNTAVFKTIQNKLISNLNAMKNVMYPTNNVPLEILAEDPLPEVRKIRVDGQIITSWAILDHKNKKSFLIDVGFAFLDNRAIEQLPYPIDAVWLTHYHDDHISGIKQLKQIIPVKIYTTKRIQNVIEHPRAYYMPCLSEDAEIELDRTFVHGETFQWAGYTFTAYDAPGQTYYHSGLLVNINNTKIFFSGDNLCTPHAMHISIPWNYLLLEDDDGPMLCAKVLNQIHKRKVGLSYIFPAHWNVAWDVKGVDFAPLLHQAEDLIRVARNLIATTPQLNDVNFGFNPQWVRCYPFWNFTHNNNPFVQKVVVTNHSSTVAFVEVEPRLPADWNSLPKKASIYIRGKSDGKLKFIITPRFGVTGKRIPLTFNITFNGKDLGELAQCLVDVIEVNLEEPIS